MTLEKKEILSLLKLYDDKKFNDLEIKILNLLNQYDNSILNDILGAVYLEQNNFVKSEENFILALKKNPNNAETYNNLGNLYFKINKIELAIKNFKRAIELKPNFQKALENLGNTYFRIRDFQNALRYYNYYTNINNKNSVVYYNLSRTYLSVSMFKEALDACDKALLINPKFVSALNLNTLIKRKIVPSWHTRMINDNPRNEFYDKALKGKINNDSVVLEIGTGSGLVSILSSQSGASKIYSCEQNLYVFESAKNIIKENKQEDKIKLFNLSSYQLNPKQHFDKMPTVLVSELISNEFLAEGVVDTLVDAKKRLVNKTFDIIPEIGSVIISLVGGEDLKKYLKIENYKNINLQGFNNFLPKKITLNYDNVKDENLISNSVPAFDFDFTKDVFSDSFEHNAVLTANKKDICYGVIQWVKIGMKNGLEYQNRPGKIKSSYHWDPVVYLFNEPFIVEENEKIEVSCLRDNSMVWFSKKI